MNTTRPPIRPVYVAPLSGAPTPVVLVIDDSATNRVVIEKQLKKLGCAVLSAVDGITGLQAIEKGGIDLVLLDCQMPDISGYEVARQVRERAWQQPDASTRHLPIIAISGDIDAAHRALCYQSGMDEILGKPISIAELRSMLLLWCGSTDATAGRTDQVIVDEALRVELHSLYRSTSLSDLATLEACAARFDLPMLGRWVHRMKGAALAIGAAHVVATLDQLEAMSQPETQTTADELATVVAMLRHQLFAP